MIIEHTYQTPLVNLNYAESPSSGLPLLLLHGGSSRWQSFEMLIPDLAPKWHVYALDLRGHGKSGRTPGAYKIQDYVPDIASFIQNCIKEPAIIFGHSLGGEIGAMAAAYHPELIRALIIGDSPLPLKVIHNHFSQQREMTKLWREWARSCSVEEIIFNLKNMMIPVPGKNYLTKASEVFGENHPWFDFMAVSISQNDPEMLTAIIDNYEATFKEYDMEKLFPLIQCPVLILRGGLEQGSLITDADANRALELLPHGQQKQISHVGHALFMQDKEAVANAIIDFMESCA